MNKFLRGPSEFAAKFNLGLEFYNAIQRLAVSLLVTYLFLAFIPLPRGIDTGLDPAWKYGISRLAADGATFGEDVIFTYGSLGYLVRGAVLSENFQAIFSFRLLVHCLLFGLTLLKISQCRNPIARLAIAIAVFLPYTISDFYQALQTEYQIVFCLLLLLSMEAIWRPERRFWAIGLGGIAGFLLHTKVSLGLQGATGIFIFLGAQLCILFLRQRNDTKQLELAGLTWLESQLAVGTTALLFLDPGNPASAFQIVAIALISSGLGFYFLPKLLQRQKINLPLYRPREVLFCVVYGLGLVALLFFARPSLLEYLQGYREITSGYSSAMSYAGSDIQMPLWRYFQDYFAVAGGSPDRAPTELMYVGSPLELLLGAIVLFSLLAVIGLSIGWGNLGLGLALLPVALLTFKHGFVRQGAHVIRFAFTMPLCLALATHAIRRPVLRRFGWVLTTVSLLFCLWSYRYYSCLYPTYYLPTVQDIFQPDRVAHKTAALFNPSRFFASLQATSETNLERVRFPEAVRQMIGGRSVDIIPWETTLVPANDLNWKPRPIFQSQAAYTTLLDFTNRDYLRNNPPDLLLYSFQAVDSRHPFFDAPATAFQMWCTYEVSPDLSDPIDVPDISGITVLSPRTSGDRCGSVSTSARQVTGWNEMLALPAEDGKIVRAHFQIRYSKWGKIVKTLFRVPPVRLTVWDASGDSQQYRLLPDNADDGVIISPLPIDAGAAHRWFNGVLPERMDKIQLSTRHPGLFEPTIAIDFDTYTPSNGS